MDLFLVSILASIVFLGLAAVQWGVDSRPFDLDTRYGTTTGLR